MENKIKKKKEINNDKNKNTKNNKNIKENNNSKNRLDLFPNINDTLKNIIFIVFVIIIISLIIFITQNDNDKEIIIPNTFSYNNVHFAKADNNLWSFGLKYNDQDIGILIHNTPYDVENIEVIGDLKSFLPSNNTYISFNPKVWESEKNNLNIALSDFGIKLASLGALIQNTMFFEDEYMFACSIDNDDVCEIIGTKTCDTNDKVIEFILDNETYIIANENCIKVYAKEKDFLKAKDRILYSWFNIMD